MEDAHIAQLNIEGDKKRAFFAVFDGHQSDEASRYCSSNFFDEFQRTSTALNGDYESGFVDTFRSMDAVICKKYHFSGTTANCIYLHDKKLYCANIGDCRSVLFRNGVAIPLSEDHKPTHPTEEQRIENAGCQVENGRVNMRLAVSRALGDVEFKDNDKLGWEEQAITAYPDVRVFDISPSDEFIIMGCDGIWDTKTNEAACTLVQTLLREQEEEKMHDISLVCEQFLEQCLARTNTEKKGTDNMSIIIIQFKPPFHQP